MAPSSTGHRRRQQPPRPLKRDNELPPASGKRRPCRDVAMVRSSQALRCPQGQSALHTLIHQRHPAPSCGGHAPTAERTMDPARNLKKTNFTESLTPDPELENSLRRSRGAFLRRSHLADALSKKVRGRAGRRGSNGPTGPGLSRDLSRTAVSAEAAVRWCGTAASPPSLQRHARGVEGLLRTTPGGLSFQDPSSPLRVPQGPTHRLGPRQRLPADPGLRRCHQGPGDANSWHSGPCGLGRRALGVRLAPGRGHRRPVPLNDASRSALGWTGLPPV